MFIDDMKKSILQKAIQGKLVEQNPNDEPASELLKRIRDEKEKLIKDGKIKKEKSLSPITDEEKFFDIPNGRVWVKVGDLCGYQNGFSFKSSDYVSNSDVYNCRMSNIRPDGKFDSDYRAVFLPNEYRDLYKDYQLKDDDIIVALTDMATENPKILGLPTLVKTNGKKMLLNQRLLKLIPYDFGLEKYLVSIMQYICITQFRKKLKGGGSLQINLKTEDIINLQIPLPPLEEQKRIVAKLDELLPLLEEARPLEKEITKLEKEFPGKLRQSILQYAIQGKLVKQDENDEPASELLKKIKEEKEKLVKEGKMKKEKALEPITDEEKLFEIPSSWEWVRLGEVIDTNIGLTYSPSEIVNSGGVAVLRSNNIQKGKMDYSNLVYVNKKIPEKCLAKRGDLLVCARNGSKSLVGKSAIITQDGMAFGAFMALVRSEFNPYIQYFLMSPTYRHRLDGVNTETINQITQENLKNTIFPFPPLEEQRRIATKLDELMKLCDELEEQINLS